MEATKLLSMQMEIDCTDSIDTLLAASISRILLSPNSCVFGLFSRNIALAVDQFQHVLDSHRWVPLPAIKGVSRSSGADDSGEDVAPPYSLMEHPPLAAFVNGED
jgi:hypothetical protein